MSLRFVSLKSLSTVEAPGLSVGLCNCNIQFGTETSLFSDHASGYPMK